MSRDPRSSAALIHELSTGFIRAQALYTVAKLGVADVIGDRSLHAAVIAGTLHADEDVLYRVMRALAGFGVFYEGEDKSFSLTPAGQLLRSDNPQSLRDSVIFRCEGIYEAFRELLHSARTGEIAFKRAFGCTHFEYLNANAEANAIFQAGMRSVTAGDVPAILSCLDFSQYETVVDVGGGDGKFLSAILSQNPHLSGTLFDQESTIELARAGADGQLRNCQFIAGDFFVSIPEGCDLYLLKSIIHDWADDPSERILRNCRRAMGGGGTLLILDRIVGPPNEPSGVLNTDLTVLVEHGGRERRLEEFEALCDLAGLSLVRVTETASPISILETRAV